MIFSSVIFLVYFLPIFLGLYFLSDRKYKNNLLLFASLLFYSWGSPKFVFLLLISTVIDFYLVRQLAKSPHDTHQKRWLFLSVFLNLGLLVYFKYMNFFLETANDILQTTGSKGFSWTEIALPLGISFYTFQTLSYSIDVYRKTIEPLHKLSDYLLFIFSFPQMIAGPIVRFSEVRSAILNRQETLDDKLQGFIRFCIGLGKKVLLANLLGEQVDFIFSLNLENLSAVNAWIGAFAFIFQVYFDFSGYSDMAIGLGQMMGFHFPENFNSPFISKSSTEFWTRWHMTLTSFMRDYLYIPLGGNRDGKYRTLLNLFIVFVLTGLWHGAAWNFVFFGLYHGIVLVVERFFLLRYLKKVGNWSIIYTTVIWVIGGVIFRSETVPNMSLYFEAMFSHFDLNYLAMVPSFLFIMMVAFFFSYLPATGLGSKLEHFIFNKRDYSSLHYSILIPLALVLFILSLSLVVADVPTPFIYFKF